MNSFLKKILMPGIILAMVVCTAGCGHGNTDGESQSGQVADEDGFFREGIEDVRYAERYQMVSLSENGILFEGDDELLHLSVIDSGEDIIMCYDPNCEHAPASNINKDPSCRAALFYAKTKTAYYEGTIYYFVSDGVFKHKLYKMKTDSAGRELMAELPFSYSVGYGVIFREDMMYYTAMIPVEDEVTNIVTYRYRLLEYNLKDNTYRFIMEETDDTIMLMHLAGDYMYMRMSDGDNKGEIYYTRLNIETTEMEVIIPGEVHREDHCYIRVYDEDSYFYWDRKTYELGIRSVDGSRKKVILRGAEGEDYEGCASPSCNGLFYGRVYDYEDEKAGCYYFKDLLTGEVTDLTRETEKYRIVAYDAYYDAFITRDSDFNWGMQSREKILAEAKAGS